MDKELILKIVKIAIPVVAFLCSTFLAVLIYRYGSRKDEVNENFILWTKKLDKSRFFKALYKDKLIEKLSKRGYMYHLHDYNLAISTYYIFKMVIALLFGLAYVIIVGLNVGIVAAMIIGFYFLDIHFKSKNKSDNIEMDDDILNLYFTLVVHAEANVYLLDTMRICAKESKCPRFREALNEFVNIVTSNKGTLLDAINVLEKRFDNKDIVNLCVCLTQAEETGNSAKMLRELLAQIESMQKAKNYENEKREEHRMLGVLIAYFVGILVYLGIGLIMGLFSTLGKF